MIKKILLSFVALVCGCVGAMAYSDITTLDNILYTDPVTIAAGSTSTIKVNMKNSEVVQAVGGELYVPEGMKILKNEYDIYGMLSSVRTNIIVHNFGMNYVAARDVYKYAIISYSGKTFSGNDGEVFTFEIAVDKDVKPGDYTSKFNEVELSNQQGVIGKRSVFEGKITVVDPTGITNVDASDANGTEEIYTAGGVRVDKIQNGFNLIKTKDGKVIKVAK